MRATDLIYHVPRDRVIFKLDAVSMQLRNFLYACVRWINFITFDRSLAIKDIACYFHFPE